MPNPKQHVPNDHFERALKGRICGVDEAGRGPLAGPVVAAAVILDPQNMPVGLNDSKALSAARRELILNDIMSRAIVSIAVAEPEEIDRLNILWASMAAMSRAVRGLGEVDHALIDGNRLPRDLPCAGTAIIKGDARSVSIAAASIVAKVTRDRLMVEADQRYPGYGLAGHKGYPTKAHMAAIDALGPTPIHRFSFGPVARAWKLI
ncbi:ribonuclease HII [Litorimonas sp. RW-G-Af-16]|uniref:ribonuclease HII n=1 Tax=Litorimonas sp. RW-G-Af-16 TaxID=3241168 RepID=UPI00390CB8C1